MQVNGTVSAERIAMSVPINIQILPRDLLLRRTCHPPIPLDLTKVNEVSSQFCRLAAFDIFPCPHCRQWVLGLVGR
jgi:hypothetical protein